MFVKNKLNCDTKARLLLLLFPLFPDTFGHRCKYFDQNVFPVVRCDTIEIAYFFPISYGGREKGRLLTKIFTVLFGCEYEQHIKQQLYKIFSVQQHY